MGFASRVVRLVSRSALGLGGIGLAALSSVAIVGHRVRRRHNPELDALAHEPTSIVHHHLRTADGGVVHVAEAGTGRPVVLLHGVTLQWWVWSPVMNLLSDRYRVIAWDMPGHGESELGSDGFTMETLCRDLAMVLDELDVSDAVLVGHSLGGCTVGGFLSRQPETLAERVGALMFVATAATLAEGLATKGSPRTLFGLPGGALLSGLRKPRPSNPWTDNDLNAGLVAMAFGPGATARMVSSVRRMIAEFPASTSVAAAPVLLRHDATAALSSAAIPTTVLAGQYDRLLPPGHSRQIANLVRGSRLVELDGVGHQIMQEAPYELVAALDDLVTRASTH